MAIQRHGITGVILFCLASAALSDAAEPQGNLPIRSPTQGAIATTSAQESALREQTGTRATSPQATMIDAPVVKVIISSSRPEVAGNGAYGIFADLENAATVPLTLYPADTQMVIQPEVAGDDDCVFSADGFYPTEPGKSDQLPKGGPIVIQPKEHYSVFWDISKSNTGECLAGPEQSTVDSRNKRRSWLDRLRNGLWEQLSFVPGDYAFVVVGKAHRMPDGIEENGYHTYTDKVKIHVGLSQIDTMIASMFGGIIGYLVMALRNTGDLGRLRTSPLGSAQARILHGLVIVRNIFSAALVSAVVTVILSRISDTQFPIKVSVNDFWGALTVGFVAYFVGNKLIDRIVGLASK